jgi:hypothetical protein
MRATVSKSVAAGTILRGQCRSMAGHQVSGRDRKSQSLISRYADPFHIRSLNTRAPRKIPEKYHGQNRANQIRFYKGRFIKAGGGLAAAAGLQQRDASIPAAPSISGGAASQAQNTCAPTLGRRVPPGVMPITAARRIYSPVACPASQDPARQDPARSSNGRTSVAEILGPSASTVSLAGRDQRFDKFPFVIGPRNIATC